MPTVKICPWLVRFCFFFFFYATNLGGFEKFDKKYIAYSTHFQYLGVFCECQSKKFDA